MMLVTELCAGGNLSTAIHRRAVTWHKRCGCIPARLLRWCCHGSEYPVCSVRAMLWELAVALCHK